MRQVNMRAQDLNLLPVLDALLDERSVTRAAHRLGMSQPAVSRALARLRAMFGDDLLVEGVGGYHLSARAEELVPALRRTFVNIEEMFQEPIFAPATATGRLRVVTPDFYAAVLIPPLMEIIGSEAPGIDLDIVAPDPTVVARLESDEFDVIVGVIDEAPAGVNRRKLFEDGYVTLLRRGHPSAEIAMTLEHYLTLEHIAISVTGAGAAPVDVLLAKLEHARRLKLLVPSFFAAVEIAARSDLVTTLPESLARNAAGMDRFVLKPTPANPGRFTLSLVWHSRHQKSPAHGWLRDAIVRAAARVNLASDVSGSTVNR